jgi:hypothetical protein
VSAADAKGLDVEALVQEMIGAARATLAGRAAALPVTVELEARRLAGVLADIGGMFARGEIDPPRAQKMVLIYQLAVRSVFRSVEGLSVVAAEQALHAVTRVAATAVNRLLGFKLL